jgi:hypothetical protein
MTDNERELLLASLRLAKDKLATAEEDVQELQKALVEDMKKTGDFKVRTAVGGESITGTLVEASRIVVDEPGLKKALGAARWGKVTKAVLDKDKLEHEIAAGGIDPNVVAAHSEEVPNKPYIRITARKAVRRVRKVSAARKTTIKE